MSAELAYDRTAYDPAALDDADDLDLAIVRWTAVLDELEASSRVRPQTLLDASRSYWEPPAGMPPLPRVLVPRAARILRELDIAVAKLAVERTSLTTHLAAIDAAAPTPPALPRYLDLSA